MEAEAGEGDRDRGDDHGEQRCVGAVAARGLAVPARPVAGQGVEERRDAERVERHHVDEQPPEEAGDGPCDRSAQERDRQQ